MAPLCPFDAEGRTRWLVPQRNAFPPHPAHQLTDHLLSLVGQGEILVGEGACRIVERHLLFDGGVAYGIDCLLTPPSLGGRCDHEKTLTLPVATCHLVGCWSQHLVLLGAVSSVSFFCFFFFNYGRCRVASAVLLPPVPPTLS